MASPARAEPAIGGNGPWEEERDGWGAAATTEPAAVNDRREGAEAWAEEREMLLLVAKLTLSKPRTDPPPDEGHKAWGSGHATRPCGTGSAGA